MDLKAFIGPGVTLAIAIVGGLLIAQHTIDRVDSLEEKVKAEKKQNDRLIQERIEYEKENRTRIRANEQRGLRNTLKLEEVREIKVKVNEIYRVIILEKKGK